jgi:cytochrome P450/NADPH-cytochrome P450 reductase
MADFETWLDKTLLPELKKLSPTGNEADGAMPDVEADVATGDRVATLHQDMQVGTVKNVQVLTAKGEQPEKRHTEVELPADFAYECGDCLAVLPQSPEANLRAVMAHVKLPNDATITLKSKVFSPLPLDTSISVADLLRNYYELAKPTTRRGLSLALRYCNDENSKKQLSALLEDEARFNKEITESQSSIFDALQKYPGIEMPFPTFLSLLPPLSARQYSISSSPLANKGTCTITYSIVTDESNPDRPFYGVATTFLSTLKVGDRIQVATRPTAKATFRLPLDAENTPLLMFGAGTGHAPFRGFIEQRAIQLAANSKTKLAPAYLFLGCRHSKRDRLYADQMDMWAQLGAVALLYAFSQEPEKSDGCRHVDDRMWKEEETLVEAWTANARAYVCGNRAIAESVKHTAREIVEQRIALRRQTESWSNVEVEKRKKEIFGLFADRAADDVFD